MTCFPILFGLMFIVAGIGAYTFGYHLGRASAHQDRLDGQRQ